MDDGYPLVISSYLGAKRAAEALTYMKDGGLMLDEVTDHVKLQVRARGRGGGGGVRRGRRGGGGERERGREREEGAFGNSNLHPMTFYVHLTLA